MALNISRTTVDELPARVQVLLGQKFFLLKPGEDSEVIRQDGNETSPEDEDEGDSYASRSCNYCRDSRWYPSSDESDRTADSKSLDEGELEELD